ncbi:MAG: trpS [Rickettsiales bacterium]|jgi:tryptophanyl-tRNA synthetase|nr:trpS [Rickettsiales bacterium]
MGRVLSGVQPTGNLHLGNYLGAIRNWVKMQHDHESLFCIVDLHAITVRQNPEELRKATRAVAAAYIACGIDPSHSAIFVQSHVPEHTELGWILGCNTPLGWLNRMTQFKEKAGKDRENASLGLYGYPVLMAADILVYKATHVPVGEDQKQHLELTRDIAGAFNRDYGKEVFPLPEPLILGEGTRVMSLRDGTKKMSKSDPSDYSRINLNDDADTVALKIRKAKSDMLEGVTYHPQERPEAANLLNIYSTVAGIPRAEAEARFATVSFSEFKKELADVLVAHLSPISIEWNKLLADTAYLDSILKKGAERARSLASACLVEVRETVGFLP